MASALTTVGPDQDPGHLAAKKLPYAAEQFEGKTRASNETVLKELESRLEGLSQSEADSRLKQYGRNEIARDK